MKSSNLIIGIVVLIAIIGGFFYFNSSGSVSGNAVSGSGNAQKIVLSFQNGNYYPNTITVKSGQPVQISLDSSVRGCYRTFTIRQLGIVKNLASPGDYVEFTPSQPGTYRFACGMGMGTGTMIVE